MWAKPKLSRKRASSRDPLPSAERRRFHRALDIEDQPAEYYYDYNQRMYHFYRTITWMITTVS